MEDKGNYVWFRWREKFSAGPSPWQYIEFFIQKEHRTKKQREIYAVEEIKYFYHNDWSEHYRGFEVEQIKPPVEEIKRIITRKIEQIERATQDNERYKALLKKYGQKT